MQYFLDTEFAEDGRVIDLISIALVSADGREYYRVSNAFDEARCNDWVKKNVLPHLPEERYSRSVIADGIKAFVRPHDWGHYTCSQCQAGPPAFGTPCAKAPKPEFWAFYADYDWVALCQLYGTMMDLPDGWPMFCHDLKQLIDDRGIPRNMLPDDPENAHDALEDARWLKRAHMVATDIISGGDE